MLRLDGIVGSSADPDLAERLHALSHRGGVEELTIAEPDAGRGRLRARTDRGTDCAIALPRGQRLRDGDVLWLDQRRAIVVRVGAGRWLRLTPRDGAVALRLGYHAGNLHWRVRFDGANLLVALDGPREAYEARLTDFVAADEIAIADDD